MKKKRRIDAESKRTFEEILFGKVLTGETTREEAAKELSLPVEVFDENIVHWMGG